MKIQSLRAGIANVHLLQDERGLVMVDTGWPGYTRAILSQIARLGYRPTDVRLIIVTHAHLDHAGSAAELKRRTGAPIAAHRGDADVIRTGRHGIPTGRGWAGRTTQRLSDFAGLQYRFEPFTPDVWLDEGQTLSDFGVEGYVVHTPGHTLGSITLALEDGVMLIGDALINVLKVGYPMYWDSPELARESVRRIHSLKPRVLYSGHGRPFGGNELEHFQFRTSECGIRSVKSASIPQSRRDRET